MNEAENNLINTMCDTAKALNPQMIIFDGNEDELEKFIDSFNKIPVGTFDILNQTHKEMTNRMPDFIEKVQTKDFRRKLNRKKWKTQRGRK